MRYFYSLLPDFFFHIMAKREVMVYDDQNPSSVWNCLHRNAFLFLQPRWTGDVATKFGWRVASSLSEIKSVFPGPPLRSERERETHTHTHNSRQPKSSFLQDCFPNTTDTTTTHLLIGRGWITWSHSKWIMEIIPTRRPSTWSTEFL